MIKIIVFDAFETLVKRKRSYTFEPYRELFKSKTKEVENPMVLDTDFLGYAKLAGSSLSKDELDDLKNKLEIEVNHVSTYSDTDSVLDAVKKEGIIACIGSNLAPEYGPAVKDILGDKISHYYYSYEMGVRKPDQKFYEIINDDLYSKYGVLKSEIMMVGDNPINDYKAPLTFGWKAVNIDRTGKTPFAMKSLSSLFFEVMANN